MQEQAAMTLPLSMQDVLVLPMHKRVITQYATSADGVIELHLYYGDKEIIFDEPELFGFGEALGAQARFVAASAMAWGQGQTWDKVQELLTHLLDEGVLEYASDHDQSPGPDVGADGARPSPLPPAMTTVARTWLECEDITRELTGQPIELGYLELVIPIFRIAHMALDTEGRQVGEANVFPKALRLDVPTNWRACIYPGSRYQDDRPMNVSALKSMRAHWPQMMACLLRMREAYLQRFPAARGGWTLGDVERLSTLVLALPTYMLMKGHDRVENGDLHPVLSSLFRVTDGLRMTTHQMLFVPVAEATMSPLAQVTSAELYAYAERNHAFASTHGVCAGPKVMIEEFLAVLLDARPARDPVPVVLDAAVEQALSHMDAAYDYGLLGLQAHAVVFSLWPVMTRTYDQMATIAGEWSGEPSAALDTFSAYLQGKVKILRNETMHATEAWRLNREHVYADIYEHCAQGLGTPITQPLGELLDEALAQDHTQLVAQLTALLQRNFPSAEHANDADIAKLVQCLLRYFVQAWAILELSCGIQAQINQVIGRAAPQREFTAADIDAHVLLQGSEARRLPHLLNELEHLLGLRVVITRHGVQVQDPTPHTTQDLLPSACSWSTSFADSRSADNRALCTQH
jgi:hypothetical protein